MSRGDKKFNTEEMQGKYPVMPVKWYDLKS